MKTAIPILGILLIALLALAGVWLFAQQEARPAVSVPATQEPVGAKTSTVTQIVLSNTSTQPTSAAATTMPTVGTPVATPNIIALNTSTPITVTVQITNPTLIQGSVNLLLLGATGSQPTILGVMQSEGNGMFSFQHSFNPTTTTQIQLEVSAAFQGQLRRVVSDLCVVSVWKSFTDPTTEITVLFPQFGPIETISSTPETSSSAPTVQLNVVDPVDPQYVISPITFAIQSNPQHLSLQAWFEQYVDYNGLLLDAGNVHSQILSNGMFLITLQGPFPQAYLNYLGGGPIPDVYGMSPDGSEVITTITPEDPAIADIGLSPDGLDAMLPSILSTMVFQ